MNAVVMQAELALEAILEEHDALLDQARGFGMRTAAFPRGLMPLKEAQGIVAKFDDNTRKLKDFLASLGETQYRAPDKATKDALTEIYDRGSKSLRKFEDDLTKAKAALVKHEDLLVGENFQDMFQALRLAVLDLDLTDKADFAAKTHLYLDANPAYAVGVVTVSRTEPKEEVYKVRATYKAETDEYLADMWSQKSNRWFPAAKKTGSARISAFVKAVVDKFKAVHDLEGETLLGSRRTVEDTSAEVSGYRAEVEARKNRALVEKGLQEATRKITEISQAINLKLRQQFPTGRTDTHRVERKPGTYSNSVVTWNSLSAGGATVQLATTLSVSNTGGTSSHIVGNYGLLGNATGTLNTSLFGTNDSEYVDRAVDALVKAFTPDPAVMRTLVRKIESVMSEVRAAAQGVTVTPATDGNVQSSNTVVRKYTVSHPRLSNGVVVVEAREGSRTLYLKVKPLNSYSESSFTTAANKAADSIIRYLQVPAAPAPTVAPTPTPTPTPAPTPTPTPTPSVGGVTPHIRAVMRALRSNIEYPGTLGAAAETEINKVLTGAAPSATLSVSKMVPVASPADPSDAASVQALARKVQGQFKNGTAQIGNVTITQKVTLKYRAQVVNLLLTIPSKDARLPGPTNPSVDLAGSVGEYFARGSKSALPARVTSFIADVEVMISRQGGRLAHTTRTAGATTFENLVWIPDVGAAFRSVRQEELEEHGHREGYPGTIAAKSGYTIRTKDPMTEAAAFAWAGKDVDRNDKWDSDALAVPVTKQRVLATDKVTVSVSARDEKEALRQAKLRIYATGRFPPNADVVVSELVSKKISETARTKTFEVTGTRKAVMTGKIDGWLFYGWAPE